MSLQPELHRRKGNRDQVAAFFRLRVGQWIAASELESVGGRQAWRTRVSECRKQLGMHIENRLRREGEHAADCPALQAWDIEGACSCDRPQIVISEYRYLDHTPLGRSADVPVPDRWPVYEAPYQETWNLTPPIGK